jgi:hypothetical protein
VDNIKINGIGTGLLVEGVGTLKWPIQDDNQNELDLYIHNALYVPSTPMGLFCPQQIAMQTQRPDDRFNALGHAGVLTVAGFTCTIPYDPRSRLPILHSIDGAHSYLASDNTNEGTQKANLTKNQQLLLRWHNRLSHLSFHKLQDLARQGKLPKQMIGCQHPVCRSCQFGKAHRRPSPDTTHPIDSANLWPGDKLSIDQLESSTPGYVDHFKGKPASARYHAASIYVDHASHLPLSNATTPQDPRKPLKASGFSNAQQQCMASK